MESLASYGSDDEQEFENETEKMGRYGGGKRDEDRGSVREEDNYDAVGMELSDEESMTPTRDDRHPRITAKSRERSTSRGHESQEIDFKSKNKTHREDRQYRKSNEHKSKKRSRSKSRERGSRDRGKDSKHRNEEKRSRSRDSPSRSRRERKRSRDRKRSGSRDRKRSSSRDRRKSESKHRRSRSRDRRDRSRTPPRYGDRYKNRFDRTSNKLAVLEKLGIEIKTPDCQFVTPQMLMQKTLTNKVEEVKNSTGIELPKYYNPAIMNPTRYAEQIQKRRLLWGGGKTEEPSPTTSTTATTAARPAPKWEQTKFVHDNDGKVASKFKRLMGIKDDNATLGKPTTEALKKQEEMFHSMEAQYEVARAATHTMRGVGLGFGAFTGNFPR